MTPLRTLVAHLADLVNAHGGATATAHGLTVERLPGGSRRVSHPDLPALLEARRRHAITHGLDAGDRALLDPATRAALNTTRRTTAHAHARRTTGKAA